MHKILNRIAPSRCFKRIFLGRFLVLISSSHWCFPNSPSAWSELLQVTDVRRDKTTPQPVEQSYVVLFPLHLHPNREFPLSPLHAGFGKKVVQLLISVLQTISQVSGLKQHLFCSWICDLGRAQPPASCLSSTWHRWKWLQCWGVRIIWRLTHLCGRGPACQLNLSARTLTGGLSRWLELPHKAAGSEGQWLRRDGKCRQKPRHHFKSDLQVT